MVPRTDNKSSGWTNTTKFDSTNQHSEVNNQTIPKSSSNQAYQLQVTLSNSAHQPRIVPISAPIFNTYDQSTFVRPTIYQQASTPKSSQATSSVAQPPFTTMSYLQSRYTVSNQRPITTGAVYTSGPLSTIVPNFTAHQQHMQQPQQIYTSSGYNQSNYNQPIFPSVNHQQQFVPSSAQTVINSDTLVQSAPATIPTPALLNSGPNSINYSHPTTNNQLNTYDPHLNNQQLPPSRLQLAARQTMPKEYPQFNGNPEKWAIFLNSYVNCTTTCGLSNGENLSRLEKCLEGPARPEPAYEARSRSRNHRNAENVVWSSGSEHRCSA